MITERRLAKLEGALSPKAATLLWLAEAHQFGSLPAYVGWLIDQPISAAPLERVPEQVRAAAVEATRGLPREVVRVSSHQAVRDAIFLVELVLRLNVAAEEATRFEGLRYAALFWEMRALTAETQLDTNGTSGRGRGTSARGWRVWRTAVSSWANDLAVAEAARMQLERRYLDGHASLFPDLAAEWQRLREQAERLAGLGDGVEGHPLRGCRAMPPSGMGCPTRRTAAREQARAEAALLADSARSAALDLLGDTDGAAAIAERRLRSEER